MARLDTPWAVAVLDSDGTMWASRHRLPLHYLRIPDSGVYLSSGELPGSRLLPEYLTWCLTDLDHIERTPATTGGTR